MRRVQPQLFLAAYDIFTTCHSKNLKRFLIFFSARAQVYKNYRFYRKNIESGGDALRCPCSWLFGKSIMTHFRLGFWAQDDDAECQNCDGAMENPSAINQNLPCQRLGFVRTAYRLKNLHWQRSKLFCKNKIVNTLARNSFRCDALRIATCIMISILQKSRLQLRIDDVSHEKSLIARIAPRILTTVI